MSVDENKIKTKFMLENAIKFSRENIMALLLTATNQESNAAAWRGGLNAKVNNLQNPVIIFTSIDFTVQSFGKPSKTIMNTRICLYE